MARTAGMYVINGDESKRYSKKKALELVNGDESKIDHRSCRRCEHFYPDGSRCRKLATWGWEGDKAGTCKNHVIGDEVEYHNRSSKCCVDGCSKRKCYAMRGTRSAVVCGSDKDLIKEKDRISTWRSCKKKLENGKTCGKVGACFGKTGGDPTLCKGHGEEAAKTDPTIVRLWGIRLPKPDLAMLLWEDDDKNAGEDDADVDDDGGARGEEPETYPWKLGAEYVNDWGPVETRAEAILLAVRDAADKLLAALPAPPPKPRWKDLPCLVSDGCQREAMMGFPFSREAVSCVACSRLVGAHLVLFVGRCKDTDPATGRRCRRRATCGEFGDARVGICGTCTWRRMDADVYDLVIQKLAGGDNVPILDLVPYDPTTGRLAYSATAAEMLTVAVEAAAAWVPPHAEAGDKDKEAGKAAAAKATAKAAASSCAATALSGAAASGGTAGGKRGCDEREVSPDFPSFERFDARFFEIVYVKI